MITSLVSSSYPRRSASAVISSGGYPVHLAHRPMLSARAAPAAATNSSAWAALGRIVSTRAKPVADDRHVDERAVGGEVHVGQHASEVVAGDDVALEVQRCIGGSSDLVNFGRLRSVALHRCVGLLGLRRVDPDQANTLAVPVDVDVDRVAVDDRDHRRIDVESSRSDGRRR